VGSFFVTVSDLFGSSLLDGKMNQFSINQTDFSMHIGISQKHLSEILRRKVFMSADVANRIEEATGMQAMMLLQLDAKYQLEKSRKKRQEQPLNKVVQRYDWAKA